MCSSWLLFPSRPIFQSASGGPWEIPQERSVFWAFRPSSQETDRLQIYDNTKFHILQHGVLHKLFPSNLYNLIFSSAAAFRSVTSLPGRNTMRRLPLRSPPRMRGKVWLHQKPGRVPGITPAYAGKSPPAKRKNPAIWDHPRVCGEKIPSSLNWPMFLGSPPRVRGKADSANLHQPKPGITPAYAGKSTGLCEHSRQEQDHPRVCGEKTHDL